MYENTAEKTGSSANKRPVCSGVVYFCAIGCMTNPKALHTNARPKIAIHWKPLDGNVGVSNINVQMTTIQRCKSKLPDAKEHSVLFLCKLVRQQNLHRIHSCTCKTENITAVEHQ